MNENDQLMTTRVRLGRERRLNPNIRNTPEWHAWEAGYAACRADTGRALAQRLNGQCLS